jgi:hypothetical protein
MRFCCVLPGSGLCDRPTEVLRAVVCLSVIPKRRQWGGLDPLGLSNHERLYILEGIRNFHWGICFCSSGCAAYNGTRYRITALSPALKKATPCIIQLRGLKLWRCEHAFKSDRFIEVQSLGPAYEAPCKENHKYMEAMKNLSLFSVWWLNHGSLGITSSVENWVRTFYTLQYRLYEVSFVRRSLIGHCEFGIVENGVETFCTLQ